MNTPLEETGPGLEQPSLDLYTPQPGVTVGNFAKHPAYKPTNDTHEANIRATMTPGPITDVIVECHLAAWNAGWYHDLKTGRLKHMNAGERMLLMISELVEAADGIDGNLMDDKLPHRTMVEVEIADFEIRLFDYCGAERFDLQRAVMESEAFEPMFEVIWPRTNSEHPLWHATRHVSKAMEAHRKQNTPGHVAALARAYRMVRWFAEAACLDVDGARIEKMAFNKVRPDHQRENRLADGGKTY